MLDNLQLLNNLSEKEKELAIKILKEYSDKGYSKELNNLVLADYKEMPADIITFIKDSKYLGKAWHTSSGACKLYPFWEKTLKEIFPDPYTTNYNNLIESGARGIGKAQPLDALVFTEDGYKPMKDITVGSKVYGEDGKLHVVTGVFPQGKKPVYKVTFTDGTSTKCCKEHLWTVTDTQYNHTETLTLEAIEKKGLKTSYLAYKFEIPVTQPLLFRSIPLDNLDPFFFGYLVGACVHHNVAIDESSIRSTILLIDKNKFDVTDEELKVIVDIIKKVDFLGLQPSKFYLPDYIKYNTLDVRMSFLKGMLFGIEYFPGKSLLLNSAFAEDIIFLIQSLGGVTEKKILSVDFDIVKVKPYLSKDFYLNDLPEDYRPPRRAIKSIEFQEEEECQCIYIDSFNHLYLTNDLIVTHNSEIAVTVGLYLMHRLMCLKDPYDFLNLKPTEQVAFAFMNITLELAKDVGISKFQNTVQSSPWFLERGTITGRDYPTWNPPSFIDIIVGSQSSHLIGRPIFYCFIDEISFIKNQSIDKQKKIATDMMDTAIGGMKTRFIHQGKNPTMLILASSKRTEKSFLEEHMKKKLEEEDETSLIIDEPVWNIKPPETYSGRKFYVAQGNRFLASEIIPDGDEIKPWKEKGYAILEVPVEFKSEFRDDIDRALCDFAGISSSDLTKYISGARLAAIRSDSYKNPFVKETLEVGNGINDTAQYSDFFDMTRIQEIDKEKPLFIHLDMSLSGDKTGIAGVWVIGKKPSGSGSSATEELYFKLAFAVSVKAPKGYQVSFAKNREFIYWLKEQGFNIKGITTDTYQNASLAQDLISAGYPYKVLSVDRADPQSKICKPYAYFKNCIYEQRLMIFDDELLTEEILGLERNENTGKVDHPSGYSKDKSDAVCGALYNASEHADEFAFYYGEDLNSMFDLNQTDTFVDQRQLEIDMREELAKILSNQSEQQLPKDEGFLDFGLGSATQDYAALLLSQGIII